jgi:hypothetical protein
MTLSELNNKLKNALKKYIRERDHVITGHLLNSIKFNSTYKDFDLKISFKSKFYIVYLEDGEFTDDFFNLQTTRDILEEFIADKIGDELTEF